MLIPPIRFQSYNPYESMFPGRRVVTRETLHLIKSLRSQGYRVVVEPDNGRPLCFIFRKGFGDWLSEPVLLFVKDFALGIITGLLSAWLYDLLTHPAARNEVHVCIEIEENGRKLKYDQRGEPISDERFQAIIDSLNSRTHLFATSRATPSPDPARPCPIMLEHTDRIVGWASGVVKRETGMFVENMRITDEETRLRMENGELQGMSTAGIVTHATCGVCGASYVDCNHITGNVYDGVECWCRLDQTLFADVSIVEDPVNPETKF